MVTVTDTRPPRLSRVTISPHRIKVGRRGTIRYRVSEPASIRAAIERRVAGVRVGHRCLRPARGRSGPRCPRFERSGVARRRSPAGRGALRFIARIRGRALPPGVYRATVRATDPSVNTSRARRVGFRIVR
jgi:hypothetical protein